MNTSTALKSEILSAGETGLTADGTTLGWQAHAFIKSWSHEYFPKRIAPSLRTALDDADIPFSTLHCFMDHLIHLDGPEEFVSECEGMICVTPDGMVDMQLLCVGDSALANPESHQWNNALAWRMIERYGEDAIVLERETAGRYAESYRDGVHIKVSSAEDTDQS